MGWVAILAGTLIAIMFVYNWFNKDNVSSAQSRTDSEQNSSESQSDDHVAIERNSQTGKAQSVPQIQMPIIISDHEPKENSSSISGQNPTVTASMQSKAASPQSSTMGPPSLPTVMAPPPLPLQRSKSPPRLKPPTIGRLPVPPRPSGGALRPPPSAASSLRVPQTKVLSNASMAPTSLMAPPKKVSKQVTLEPGHSPLDWAALTSNPNSRLRGKDASDGLINVTPSQLKMQNGRKDRDAWTVYQGKVYNITPYVPFHPGGRGELLRGAGKDSAKLFMEVHPWVNWDGMLGECCVGILVGEDEATHTENRLDEMD